MFGLHLLSPVWLLALALVPLVAWTGRRSLAGLGSFRRWASLALRALLVAAAVLALAEACWRQISREVSAVYLVDCSASVSAEEHARIMRYVKDTAEPREKDGRRADDRFGLVVFADGSSVELAPAESSRAPFRLHSNIAAEHSDLAEGLRMAAASFPAGARKRVVLISDGIETRGLAMEEARRLAELGVRVECLPIVREQQPEEVMLDRLVVRSEARAGEPVQVRAVIRAQRPASGEIELWMEGSRLAARRFRIAEAGRLQPETFDVNLPGPGFYPIEVRLRPDPGCDTVLKNNVGYAFTQLKGKARVLLVYGAGGADSVRADLGHLVAELLREKIEVRIAGPAEIPASSAELAGYDCVILANVGAHAFTRGGMEAVRSAVRDLGVGLVMIGGPDSFGAGGYLNTPIEEALPVSCEVRQRKVMPNGALALIMHTCEMPQPNYWGRRISHAAVDALSDQDEAGFIYYGMGGCSWLFRLMPIGPNRANMHKLIKDADPGDMPDFDTSLNMALKALKGAKAALKHCIVISDGDPSLSDPTLPGQFKAAKITVSTVAIAPHNGGVGTMQNIAAATGGRFYFPQNPNLLPQIFVKEASTVRRSVIFQQPFVPKLGLETDPVKGFAGAALPQLDGYVVTTPKDRAEVPLTVQLKDGPEDPVLAHWRYGEGKAVAFTSSAASDWASKWISWPGYAKFWAQVVRWAGREGGTGDLQVRTEVRGGAGKIVVEAIDEKGRLLNQLDLACHVVDPRSREVPGVTLVQTAPGRYEADFPAGAAGAYQVNVSYKDATGVRRNHVAGAASSYPTEYARVEGSPELLRDIARATGGEVLSGDAGKDRLAIWARNLPPGYRIYPGWEWLLWAVLVLFPLDVAIRRVMIDWRALGARCKALAAVVMPRLRPAMAGPDPTMAALMAEKDRLRQAAPPPASEDVRSRFLEQLGRAHETASPAEDDGLRAMLLRHKDAQQQQAAADRAASAAGRKAAPPRPTGISGYAGALLDAKKRALKEQEQDKDKGKGQEKPPGKG